MSFSGLDTLGSRKTWVRKIGVFREAQSERYENMNCMRNDPNYTTSKNGKHRKELKTVLRSIYDSPGRYPGYRTVMAALHERGYKCGQQMARELLRTLWYEE